MALLIDLFGYLSIVLHGVVIAAQSVALGGAVFLALCWRGSDEYLAPGTARAIGRAVTIGAITLIGAELATVTMQSALLMGTAGVPLWRTLTAPSAIAGLVKVGAMVGVLAWVARPAPRAFWPLGLAAIVTIGGAVATTHAAARLEDRGVLLAASALHLTGAAIWLGGIPAFLIALARLPEGAAVARYGARFSKVSAAGVACIAASATLFTVFYIGSPQGAYGTAYGVMAGAKTVLFSALLLLGLGNFLLIRRLGAWPVPVPVLRLRRFAEAELMIGLAVVFAAASLTSVPPAVDLRADRVSFAEIVERNTPVWPRLASPERDSLALPALQQRLDAEAAARSATPLPAIIPGSGDLPPRNAADVAWSEYNHHWAGLFVIAIGLLALFDRAGFARARHWPALFLGLAGFLLVRSDPEAWPLGDEGFWEGFRDVEVFQHRIFVVLIVAFAAFEWRVRVRGQTTGWQPKVFPLLCGVGGILLLTHSHAIANIKDQLLIELTHTPLALAGLAAGVARWLELRLPGPVGARAAWVWPVCLAFCGVLLLDYREA